MADNPLVGVSGPSTYSKRTYVGTPEMKLGSIAYGEGKETQAIKSGAPLAKTPDVTPSQAPSVPAQQISEIGLFDPTQRPEEPITAGIDIGAGPGSNVLTLNKSTAKLSDTLAAMIPFDTTGEITILYQQALARGQ